MFPGGKKRQAPRERGQGNPLGRKELTILELDLDDQFWKHLPRGALNFNANNPRSIAYTGAASNRLDTAQREDGSAEFKFVLVVVW